MRFAGLGRPDPRSILLFIRQTPEAQKPGGMKFTDCSAASETRSILLFIGQARSGSRGQ